MLKRKNQSTFLEVKYDAVKRLGKKEATQEQIAQELGVARCSVSRWLSQQETIIEAYESILANGNRKRMRSSKYEKIDESLYEWFKDKRALNIPLNGPILVSKAEDFAALHNDKEFKATNGWLDLNKYILQAKTLLLL